MQKTVQKDWFADSFSIRHGIILFIHAKLSLRVCRKEKIFGYFCHDSASKRIYKYRRHEMCTYVYCSRTSASPFIIWYAESVGRIKRKNKRNRRKRKKKKMRLHPILQRGAVIDREIGWACARERRGQKLLPSLQIRDTRDVHLYRELLMVGYAHSHRQSLSIVINPLSVNRLFLRIGYLIIYKYPYLWYRYFTRYRLHTYE